MTSVTRAYSGLGATQKGQSRQLTNAYKGLADEMKRRKSGQPAESDEPQTLAAAKRLIAHLRSQLADAQALIEEMRSQANGDAPVISTSRYWGSKRVAAESHCAVCTICRNAELLGGVQIGNDWMFPPGTVYSGRPRGKQKQPK